MLLFEAAAVVAAVAAGVSVAVAMLVVDVRSCLSLVILPPHIDFPCREVAVRLLGGRLDGRLLGGSWEARQAPGEAPWGESWVDLIFHNWHC